MRSSALKLIKSDIKVNGLFESNAMGVVNVVDGLVEILSEIVVLLTGAPEECITILDWVGMHACRIFFAWAMLHDNGYDDIFDLCFFRLL